MKYKTSLITLLLLSIFMSTTLLAQNKDKPAENQAQTTEQKQEQNQAQTGTPDTQAQELTDEASERQNEGIVGLIIRGGWTMLGLAIISTIILAFAIERFLYFRKQNVDTKGFNDDLESKVQSMSLSQIAEELQKDPRLIARIIGQSIAKHSTNTSELENDIERRATVAIGRLERGLNLLANFGNLAPLLGFFGTVVGMRTSFLQFVIQKAPTAQDLAGGVEEALITTAAGLLVAIPTYLVYNLFIYRIDTLGTEIEVAASTLRETQDRQSDKTKG